MPRFRLIVGLVLTATASLAIGGDTSKPDDCGKYVVSIPMLWPHDQFSGKLKHINTLTPEETAAVLNRSLPPVSDVNTHTPLLTIIAEVTQRTIIFTPPLPPQLVTAEYGSSKLSVNGQRPTVGMLLQSIMTILSGDDATPFITRVAATERKGQAEVGPLSDVYMVLGLYVTKEHLVVVALPDPYVVSETDRQGLRSLFEDQ